MSEANSTVRFRSSFLLVNYLNPPRDFSVLFYLSLSALLRQENRITHQSGKSTSASARMSRSKVVAGGT